MVAAQEAKNNMPDNRRSHLLSTEASERASEGMGNLIVTRGDRTHVVWQDSSDTGYWARARTFDRQSGEWSATATPGPGVDNHARPCLACDGRGFLHVIIGGHNSPLRYTHSVRPDDTSAWTPVLEFGGGTYPTLLCGSDDTLYLGCRAANHDDVVL